MNKWEVGLTLPFSDLSFHFQLLKIVPWFELYQNVMFWHINFTNFFYSSLSVPCLTASPQLSCRSARVSALLHHLHKYTQKDETQ